MLLGALLALASFRPLPAHAQSPAPGDLLRLDNRVQHARKARITSPSGWLVADGVRVGVEGIDYRNALSSSGGETPPSPGRIPWDDVVRLEVPSNHTLTGAIVATLVVGGIMGGAVYSAGQRGDDIGGGGVALLAIPVATSLGAVVGSQARSWHRIYRGRNTTAR